MDVKERKMIEDMTDRERAEAIFTWTGLFEVDALCSDIGELLQLSNAHITATPNKEDTAYEYLLTYDNGSIYLCTLNSTFSRTSTTVAIVKHLKDIRDNYAKVFLNSSRIFNALVMREKEDNAKGVAAGFVPYTIKRISIVTADNKRAGMVLLVLDVNGVENFFLDSTLTHFALHVDIERLSESKKLTVYDLTKDVYIYNGFSYPLSKWEIPEGITIACRDTYRRN